MDNNQRKQQTIAEAIKRKRLHNVDSEHEQEETGTPITAYLRVCNDISSENHYRISTFAKVYIRDHTNIDEVVREYMAMQKITDECIENYLTPVIRRAISYERLRYFYPYNIFKFYSANHQMKAKFLLKYPAITNEEDLEEAMSYMNRFSLKHCQIDLSLGNDFHQDAQHYLKEKKEIFGPKKVANYANRAADYAMRKYNQQKNLLIDVHIDDLTLEELLEISNFKEAAEYKIKKKYGQLPAKQVDEIVNLMFNELKKDKSTVFKIEFFKPHPSYNIITNNLTEEQVKQVTISRTAFYERTNAKYLLQLNKKNIPISDENLDIVGKRKERRLYFWRQYIYLENKLSPPFNNLQWINTSNANQNPAIADEAGPSNIHLWKGRIVQQVNNAPGQPGTSNVLLPQQQATQGSNNNNNNNNNQDQTPKRSSFKEFIAISSLPRKYYGIVNILKKQNYTISRIENEMMNEDRDLFEVYWEMNSESIICNYIHSKLIDEDLEFFRNAILKCPDEEIRCKIRDELKSQGIDVLDNFGEPLASSTQNMEMIVEEVLNDEAVVDKTVRPFQNFTNSSEDIVIGAKNLNDKPATSAQNVEIKLEKFTPQPLESLDSDCQIITAHSIEVITLSEEEVAIDQGNKSDVIERADRYRQNLNFESQGDPNPEEQTKEYKLLSRSIAYENVTTRAFRKQSNEKSGEPSSKSGKIEIIGQDDHQESNNFSIFLSSQLMLDYARHNKLATSLTFTKSFHNTNIPRDFSRYCFMFEIQRVLYRKNHTFEIFINIPQFSLFGICVQNAYIREIMNLNDQNWQVLINNLSLLESYNFVKNQALHRKEKGFEYVVKDHLDLLFSSLSSFKKFHFNLVPESNKIECINTDLVSSIAKDVTKCLNSNILDKIKLYNSRC